MLRHILPNHVRHVRDVIRTENAHFSFEEQLYSQTDDFAIDSPLGPTITNIFVRMIES